MTTTSAGSGTSWRLPVLGRGARGGRIAGGRPRGTAAGLWVIRRDTLNTQMRQRATNLRWMRAINPPVSLRRVEVVAAAGGVEAQGQTVLTKHLQQALKRRCGAFLGHQKAA